MKWFGALSLLAALCLPALPAARAAQSPVEDAPWGRVLDQYVTEDGRVDYVALKAHPADLDRFVAEIAARSPLSDPAAFPARDARLAYWINAYNALVIHGVVENWPIKSVREIGWLPFSFFWRKKFTVGGREMTLNDIEDRLRHTLKEPRIHFAIVCASLGCPHLSRTAYTPENVEQQLDRAARIFINEPRNLKINPARNRVTLSWILTHYSDDFVRYLDAHNVPPSGQPRLLDYVRIYASPEHRAALDALKNPAVKSFEYDWGVNDIHARPDGVGASSSANSSDTSLFSPALLALFRAVYALVPGI